MQTSQGFTLRQPAAFLRRAESPPLLTRKSRFDGVKPEIPEWLVGVRVNRIVENEQNVIFLMGAVIGQNLAMVMTRRVRK